MRTGAEGSGSMAHSPQVSVRTMALLVLVAALDFWSLTWLTRPQTVTRGSGLSAPGAAMIVGLVTLSGVVVGLVSRRGIDRTLAHLGLAAPMMLGLVRMAAQTDLTGLLVAVGSALVLGTLVMGILLGPEAREHRSTWWWELVATVAASFASVTLTVVIVAILGALLVLAMSLK